MRALAHSLGAGDDHAVAAAFARLVDHRRELRDLRPPSDQGRRKQFPAPDQQLARVSVFACRRRNVLQQCWPPRDNGAADPFRSAA